MKAIIVARVSTEEQREAGNSLPAQLARMNDYCQRNNYEIIETFSFDESAYKTKRDEFDKIIGYINSSKDKVAVCFDKVDRLSRNIFDKRVSLLYERAVNNQIELHFVSDNQIINDKMNAGDKFAFGMKLGLSKYYSDAISDNVKRVLENKRRNGEWTGAVRLGYLNVPLDEDNRTRKGIIIDPNRVYLVQKMFELYSTGQHSLESIRLKITEMGLRTLKSNCLSKSGVENILKDSFYCGIAISRKYGKYPHVYPRLISRELYDKCQEVRSERNKKPYKTVSKDFILKGLLRCQNCGCVITAENHKNKPTYYSCTNGKKICKRIYVNEKDLLEPIYKVLNKFESISEEVQNGLVEELRKSTESEVVFHNMQMNRIRKDYDTLKAKKARLLDMFLEGTSITKDDYDKKHEELQDQIQRLEIEMSEHTKADHDYQTTVATVISVARRAKQIFENSSEISEKRAFLSNILQNPTLKEKKLYFTIASPFDLVLKLSEHPNWLLR